MQEKDTLFENRLNDYIAGTITDEEKAELFSLVRSSELYRLQYNKAAKLHALLHVPALEAGKNINYQHLSGQIFGVPEKKNSFTLWIRFAAAAVVLMALASSVSIFTYKRVTSTEILCEAIVPLGSQTQIMLPDSSVVVLNSGSVLKYPSSFGGKERNVYLTGEGYFKVAKNKAKTFQVYAGDAKVQVTGTVFNVRSYPEDRQLQVDLIEGGVNVLVGDKFISLKPDEKAIYNRETGKLEHITCDAYKSTLWTTGKLAFVNTSFKDILKEIERKYNVKIRIMSPQAEKEYFTGTINEGMPLQEVFNFIDVDKKYSFENSGSTIILRDR